VTEQAIMMSPISVHFDGIEYCIPVSSTFAASPAIAWESWHMVPLLRTRTIHRMNVPAPSGAVAHGVDGFRMVLPGQLGQWLSSSSPGGSPAERSRAVVKVCWVDDGLVAAAGTTWERTRQQQQLEHPHVSWLSMVWDQGLAAAAPLRGVALVAQLLLVVTWRRCADGWGQGLVAVPPQRGDVLVAQLLLVVTRWRCADELW
jgi:hypothetical protein